MSKQAGGPSGEAREGAMWTRAGDKKLHSCWWPQQKRMVLKSEMRVRLVGKQEKWSQWVFTQRGLDKILETDGCLLGKQEEETGSC